ncbi:GNAT family N-acetyltransferase [Pseudomonas fulva]|uniref:GNAT family N-acetyltransferase n=1 Tax=Pseudomonas fulva TaxID=47880 RepID=UPI002DBCF9EF|nr:GNAT family N-acetyltransferase [Pseudomonas fulva]MEB8058951.1 GNAT family N-acetyltransferase [Pseudomonas fulva]
MLDHFYRQQGSRMRAPAQGKLWVARAPGIIAGLSLSEVESGQWLTGLFVAPDRRSEGVGMQLVAKALENACGSTWLFCHPTLANYYARQGFAPAGELPQSLRDKLQRYQRSKALIALERTAHPGQFSAG